MKKLAVLGPKGTYSDIAAQKYIKDNNLDLEIIYYPSILKTAIALDNLDLAILPFENTLDGFVIESMDNIIAHNFKIISQVKLDIDFAFVTNAKRIEDCKNVYCQFKAYGQCIDFISKYDFNIIKTESNSQTVEKINESDNTFGAIIPIHSLNDNKYNLVINHVADREHNETRFFIVSKDKSDIKYYDDVDASIVITIKEDRPGVLFEILKELNELEINMNSIMSRPMKTEMGKYKFYIELSLKINALNKLEKLTNELTARGFLVDILGVYNVL